MTEGRRKDGRKGEKDESGKGGSGKRGMPPAAALRFASDNT